MKTLFTALIFAVFAAVSNAQFTFYYTGQGYITQGKTETITSSTWTVTPSTAIYGGNWYHDFLNVQVLNFQMIQGSDRWLYLDFSAPAGTLIEAGKTYQAVRYPFEQLPFAGLNFSGDGRGSNMLTGQFHVYDFVTGSSGQVLSAAIDFIQYSEGNLSSWSFGSVRYNSLVPINFSNDFGASAIPEPSTYAAIFGALALSVAFSIRRRQIQTNSVLSVG